MRAALTFFKTLKGPHITGVKNDGFVTFIIQRIN